METFIASRVFKWKTNIGPRAVMQEVETSRQWVLLFRGTSPNVGDAMPDDELHTFANTMWAFARWEEGASAESAFAALHATDERLQLAEFQGEAWPDTLCVCDLPPMDSVIDGK